jgi:hypothetical protein
MNELLRPSKCFKYVPSNKKIWGEDPIFKRDHLGTSIQSFPYEAEARVKSTQDRDPMLVKAKV